MKEVYILSVPVDIITADKLATVQGKSYELFRDVPEELESMVDMSNQDESLTSLIRVYELNEFISMVNASKADTKDEFLKKNFFVNILIGGDTL